jgi:hypothetical protein
MSQTPDGKPKAGSTLTNIVLGNVIRSGLVALITFFVTKNVIQADVASHLMRGDTVQLWNGTIGLNMTMIVNVLVGLIVPILVPIAWGIWVRMKNAYETIVARSENFAMSAQELQDRVSDTSLKDIIKTVAANSPPPAATQPGG